MKDYKGREKIEAMLKSAEYLSEIFDEDFAVGVTDCQKFLKMVPGKKLDLKTKPGDPIPIGSGIHKALNEKRQVRLIVPREVYGIPFISTCTPIFDEQGVAIGCIGIGMSIEQQDKLRQISEEFASAFQEVLSSIDSISYEAQQLSSLSHQLNTFGANSEKDLKDVGKITNYIKKVSDQANLLGLNASIEAARAGQAGLGFSVVAEEIRKLSDNTKVSADDINQTIDRTNGTIEEMLNCVQNVSKASEEQAAAIEEIIATMQELSARVQELAEMASRY
jgi:hypothetical protein